jgi:hypothetical protein
MEIMLAFASASVSRSALAAVSPDAAMASAAKSSAADGLIDQDVPSIYLEVARDRYAHAHTKLLPLLKNIRRKLDSRPR